MLSHGITARRGTDRAMMAAFASPSRAVYAVFLVLCAHTNALSPPAKPIAAQVMDAVVGSELWRRIMVPQAKKTMRDTAEANGVDWSDALDYIKNAATWDDDASADDIGRARPAIAPPRARPAAVFPRLTSANSFQGVSRT